MPNYSRWAREKMPETFAMLFEIYASTGSNCCRQPICTVLTLVQWAHCLKTQTDSHTHREREMYWREHVFLMSGLHSCNDTIQQSSADMFYTQTETETERSVIACSHCRHRQDNTVLFRPCRQCNHNSRQDSTVTVYWSNLFHRYFDLSNFVRKYSRFTFT